MVSYTMVQCVSFRNSSIGRLGNNLAGQYKRALGMGIQIGIGNFAGAIASNIYLSQDAPRYILGRMYILFEVVCSVLTVCQMHLSLCS